MAVVLQWVNSGEARLSKTVTSLEKAFGSGYLLGELLYKRGMLEKKQYEALVDADDMETALQNFDVVVGALEAAQVPFDKAEIGKIVMRQREKTMIAKSTGNRSSFQLITPTPKI